MRDFEHVQKSSSCAKAWMARDTEGGFNGKGYLAHRNLMKKYKASACCPADGLEQD